MSGASCSSADQATGLRFPTLPPPLQRALQEAGASVRKEGEKGLTHLHGTVSTHLSNLQSNIDSVRAEVGKTVSHAIVRLQQRQLQSRQRLAPGFASLSLAGTGRPRSAPQVVADMAMHPGEVAARLKGIVVYTVVNKKNDFVLVTGEGSGSATKQLGLFFFSEADANSLISKIEEQDPKLGRQSQVLPVSMDQVYKFALSPKRTEHQSATFRFMPSSSEVQNAVQLYRDAGLDVDSFVGVPVFQVEGLNISTEKAKYTPLFFSKSDLDRAVVNSSDERESKATAVLAQRREKAEAELEKAKEELENAADEKARRRAESKCNKASARATKAEAKLQELKLKSKPKVEVGSLEEVIANMEMDSKGQWGDVMFIPPGSLAPH
eukprot:CAMPEP_0117667950 /NCGR_PEP_ID=MMETSP0804-20121206/11258_1 /TAXON_ID=1074897 /ORGANISM="Tetraselmis astigmatica, Strain CCMP880" /LENGTH=379 /DNA_ID=CAMNT_0005475747 /DNA_START=189 /DNA_END=1328 /DNA_ORIENTATION=-